MSKRPPAAFIAIRALISVTASGVAYVALFSSLGTTEAGYGQISMAAFITALAALYLALAGRPIKWAGTMLAVSIAATMLAIAVGY